MDIYVYKWILLQCKILCVINFKSKKSEENIFADFSVAKMDTKLGNKTP